MKGKKQKTYWIDPEKLDMSKLLYFSPKGKGGVSRLINLFLDDFLNFLDKSSFSPDDSIDSLYRDFKESLKT